MTMQEVEQIVLINIPRELRWAAGNWKSHGERENSTWD